MKLIGNLRLGKDVEVRYAGNNQTPVATLFGAYNYGKKVDGKRPTQWVEATLWGAKAEALQEYLVTGEQFLVTMNDVHVETYTKNNGETGVKLTGSVIDIDFVGGSKRPQEQQAAPQRQQAAPRQAQRQATAQGSGFDDMEDDVPF